MKGEITIYDIAKELDLSASTVSRALQNNKIISKDTRKKVQNLAAELGYRSNSFASNLRRRKTNTLGVIVPRLDSNFMSSCLAGMEEEANKNGYNLILAQSFEEGAKEAQNAKTMFDNRVDGLIVSLAVNSKNLNHFNSFIKKGIPVVFFDRIPNSIEATCISIDNYKAGYSAAKHLVDVGCTRLAHVTLNRKVLVYAEREEGFNALLNEKGLTCQVVTIPELSLSQGIKAGDVLFNMNPIPDGVFVSNDMAAVGIMLRLQELGIEIPQSVAIIGFNNEPVATIANPKLSSMDYPGREAGVLAVRNMLEQLENTNNVSIRNVVLNSSLVVRESSKRTK